MFESTSNEKETTGDILPIQPSNIDEEIIKIKPMRLNRTQKKLIKFERKRAYAKQKKAENRLKRKLDSEKDLNDTKNNKPLIQFTSPYIPKTEGYLNHRDLKKLRCERLRKVYENSSNSLKVILYFILISFSKMLQVLKVFIYLDLY